MNALNSILIEGNLTRDPEMKYINSGTALTQFSIGVNKSFKQGDDWKTEVSYFDVQAWGKLAEICAQHLKKGRGVRISGELKQNRWDDAEGKPKSRVFIVAEHVEFKPEKLSELKAAVSMDDDNIPF